MFSISELKHLVNCLSACASSWVGKSCRILLLSKVSFLKFILTLRKWFLTFYFFPSPFSKIVLKYLELDDLHYVPLGLANNLKKAVIVLSLTTFFSFLLMMLTLGLFWCHLNSLQAWFWTPSSSLSDVFAADPNATHPESNTDIISPVKMVLNDTCQTSSLYLDI